MRSLNLALALVASVLAGCAAPPPAATSLPAFATSTLAASSTPSPTAGQATSTATTQPPSVGGTTTTQPNVRPAPLSASTPLGVIPASASVEILGKDPGGNWLRIVYPGGKDGTGWVAAQYVSVSDTILVPVIGAGISPSMASLLDQVYVRAGPGTSFKTLGTLNARDAVWLSGRDSTGAWVQIDFAAGPDGKGWVAASFLEAASLDALQVITEKGEIIGTATPTGSPAGPQPTPDKAFEDGDSAAAPAVSARFSPLGAGSIYYTNDLSAPDGDRSDWIEFTPYFPDISISLSCSGNGEMAAVLREAGDATGEGQNLECGENRILVLHAGKAYVLRLDLTTGAERFAYMRYTASIYGTSRQ